MQRRFLISFLTVSSMVLAPFVGGATDRPIPAKLHLVKTDKGTGAAKLAKVVSRASKSGPTFPLPSPGGTADPTVAGGWLRFCEVSDVGIEACAAIPLPAASWKGLGKPAGKKGYLYKGAGTPADPCTRVLVKSKAIRAVCKGPGAFAAPTPFDLPVGPQGVAFEVALGADRYCAESSPATAAESKKDSATLWKAIGAGAPAECRLELPTNVSVCGNDVAEPGEQCDGDDLRGFTCETAYRLFDDPNTQECFGDALACDEDCTFNSENTDACQCSCEEDFDCAFPDDPDSGNRPIGIDCTLLWCPKQGCPCDHLADPDTYAGCVDENFEACETFDDCLLDVGCFIGDVAFVYDFSTAAGICGEEQPGICDTDAASSQATEEIRRQICTSTDFLDPEFFRCEFYCDSCDCSDPDNLGIYNPDEGDCS